MMEMVVTIEAIRCAKLQSNGHYQQTDTQIFTGWMPFLLPNQQCQSRKGETCKLESHTLCQNHAYTYRCLLLTLLLYVVTQLT